MEEFWILILVALFATNSLDKAKSVKVKLEKTQLKTFDEIFGEGWWDKDEAEDLKIPPTNFGQNVHPQIDRQNTQLGQIEPNPTDQNPPLTESDHYGQIEPNLTDQNPLLTESDRFGQIEPNSTDQNPLLTESDRFGQIEPNSTDQNPPLTESNHSDNAKNGEEQNQLMKEITSSANIIEAERKRKIIAEFHAMRNEFKQIGKYSKKERTQIENEISTHLGVNRKKIYKWKKEFGLGQKRKMHNIEKKKNERKNLLEKFDQMKGELKRGGFKNSYSNQIDETVAKELGISKTTIYDWKRELGQSTPNHIYAHSEQKELMKRYYKIKDKKPKISDLDIAKSLKIGSATLFRWKRQFKRHQLHPNSVDGHSLEENAAANVQEIDNSNSESI